MPKKIILGTLIIAMLHAAAYAVAPHVYETKGKRDPFVPLLGVNVSAASSLDDIVSIDDVVLQGIVTGSGGEKIAILNGEMIGDGKTKGRVTVKSISENKVIVKIDDEERTIAIYEENKK